MNPVSQIELVEVLITKAESLCDAIENKDDFQAVKYALRAGRALNELRAAITKTRAIQPKQSEAAADVLAERRRQIDAEGMTPAGDDSYHAAELPRAAAAYILNGANDEAPSIWPWTRSWWKPRDARANYVRAAALLLAEIERLDRLQTGLPEGLLRSAQGGAE
ncbi:hypothetical protein [Stutzerimonas nitrititolerans]|uniref:hypothetical protein n=1 Tax=Stutzerimonas nitrititolerans TaxID=2482751 RepID=UPI0028AB13D1|nr:hypothetical protein [Stutzerimonas nitrititolerans]